MDSIDRILTLMTTNGITAAQLTREISLTNGLITQWKSRKQKPSTDAIIKLAQYFQVSTDFLLLGRESTSAPTPLISHRDQELLTYFHKLDDLQQERCIGYVEGLADKSQDKKISPAK